MSDKFKFDGGKLQHRLIPPKAIEQLAAVMTYGTVKYSAHSWKNVSSERYLDALYRHLEARRLGHVLDEESGLPHLAHAAANLMFLLERDSGNGEMGKALTSFYEEAAEEIG